MKGINGTLGLRMPTWTLRKIECALDMRNHRSRKSSVYYAKADRKHTNFRHFQPPLPLSSKSNT